MSWIPLVPTIIDAAERIIGQGQNNQREAAQLQYEAERLRGENEKENLRMAQENLRLVQEDNAKRAKEERDVHERHMETLRTSAEEREKRLEEEKEKQRKDYGEREKEMQMASREDKQKMRDDFNGRIKQLNEETTTARKEATEERNEAQRKYDEEKRRMEEEMKKKNEELLKMVEECSRKMEELTERHGQQMREEHEKAIENEREASRRVEGVLRENIAMMEKHTSVMAHLCIAKINEKDDSSLAGSLSSFRSHHHTLSVLHNTAYMQVSPLPSGSIDPFLYGEAKSALSPLCSQLNTVGCARAGLINSLSQPSSFSQQEKEAIHEALHGVEKAVNEYQRVSVQLLAKVTNSLIIFDADVEVFHDKHCAMSGEITKVPLLAVKDHVAAALESSHSNPALLGQSQSAITRD